MYALGLVIKPLRSTVKGMKCFKLIKSHKQSHSYTRNFLRSILWDERVYKDCIFFEILLVKEDKLLQLHDVI